MDGRTKLGLLNLHDAFLNVGLVEKAKWASPIERDPALFPISDHGRFERVWITFLYVLVEAWRSPQMAPVREYVRSVVSIDELEAVLLAGEEDGSLAKMRDVRHYMCHRDRRQYWDDGRLAPCGQVQYHVKLQSAFSKVLFAAVRAAEVQR